MKNTLFLLFIFTLLPVGASCPEEFNGKYIWLNEINKSNNNFFNNELIVTVSLDEDCQKLSMSWRHADNFTLAWENIVGDFQPLPSENSSQKLIIQDKKMIEIYLDFVLQKTTRTEYKLLNDHLLEIKTISNSWSSLQFSEEFNYFQRL